MWRYQLVRRVHNRGTPEEEAIISVHAAYFPSPNVEVPDAISPNPAPASGTTVADVADLLRGMVKAPGYPLLNWHGFGIEANQGKFVFYCRSCDMEFTGEAPILKCPVPHEEAT